MRNIVVIVMDAKTAEDLRICMDAPIVGTGFASPIAIATT